ncbi:MAG: tRNA (adenosine(37)-N6)-dimethylallyltransferase MiaA [Betaproteobacteria bacterium]|jgi:tRNA dimethylallyltransferase|nr:tRNA (adenosine(37)-N6)-dimethylallyltransferase MiaA [Betaproteobacteria bacterium]
MSTQDQHPLIFLMGPTGAGKSAVAMALAAQLPIDIVSVDSAQVYRGLDIGTAKPSLAERALVPHWLLDLLDPSQAYSAARFRVDAQVAIEAIRAKGRIPLLVGGTMLYARALVGGLDDLPSANPALRAQLEAEAQADGWPTMHARLADLDPVTAARLSPTDSQRIQRALEVVMLTGTPLSTLQGRPKGSDQRATDQPAHFVSLEPRDRSWLHQRLETRFKDMVAAGLLDEVRALRARGDLHTDLPSIRSVGYRQVWAHLDGDGDLQAMHDRAVAATRQLAKRQLTWLRSNAQRTIVPCDTAQATSLAVTALRAAIG